MTPMQNHKTVCRDLAPQGWVYGGHDGDFYLFQTGNYQTGFRLMQCLDEDLTPDNLKLMAEMGLTR